jgi:hypothetical protein
VLFLRGQSPSSALLEVSPTTLAVVNTIPLGGHVIDMKLSPGGTEWLVVWDTGAQNALAKLPVSTLAPTVLATPPGYNPTAAKFVTTLNSTTIQKAYFTENGGWITPFSTDPSTTLSPVAILPLYGTTYLVLQN